MPTPTIKLAQTDAVVVFFQNRPYMNGARKAPARAPQEIPISCAMKVGGSSARITEITMKNTIRTRMISSCCFSFISFTIFPLIRSSVRVELEVRTKEDRVDMEAERTRITTTPISTSGRVESMAGMIASYATVPSAL